MKICFGTHNKHKFKEVKGMVNDSLEVVSLESLGHFGDIPEVHDTMEENSLSKAVFVYDEYGVPTFADDSGLEVEILGGEPGVYSAMYAGPQRCNITNITLLLDKMKGMNNRSAQFKTVISYVDQYKRELFIGTAKGMITEEQRGEQGLGYDSVFIPEGYDMTFAEMGIEEKNKISARSKAFEKFMEFIESYKA